MLNNMYVMYVMYAIIGALIAGNIVSAIMLIKMVIESMIVIFTNDKTEDEICYLEEA